LNPKTEIPYLTLAKIMANVVERHRFDQHQRKQQRETGSEAAAPGLRARPSQAEDVARAWAIPQAAEAIAHGKPRSDWPPSWCLHTRALRLSARRQQEQ